jgi:hypothetical protein
MGDWGGKEQQEDTQQYDPYYTSAGVAYNPYQQLLSIPSVLGAGGELLGGTGMSQVNSPGFNPTGGWQGSGNANMVPGAAAQLLRMARSPMYMWS